MNKKLLYSAILTVALGSAFSSCSDEELNSESIFDTTEDALDPNSYTYSFDKWLKENYSDIYNMEFRYKMQHIGTDMDYNLVPARYDKAVDLALLTKYLWFDVYGDLVGPDFLKQYGPKIIHLIGSPAFNPANHTEILGLAEGGLKVSLFKVNELDVTNPDLLNEHYFKTMHHEFSHILHQTKTYPKEFDLINASHYEPNNWQDRNGALVNSLGFTTTYASSQAREDFAETCANYITRTDAQWDLCLWMADRGWESTDGEDYAYCYYFYANDADREAGHKTYVGEFVAQEGNNGIFGVANILARPSSDGAYSRSYIGNGYTVYSNVADVEAFIASASSRYDIIPVPDSDNMDGKANILQKVSIARNWFSDAWGLDIDALRAEVQKRQASIDMDELRSQIK
jgi:hypothetical protein